MTTKIVDDRNLALAIGYIATHWPEPVAYEEYLEITRDWKVAVLYRDLEPIGAVYRKDGETHVSVLPHWRRRWATKGVLKEILSDMRVTSVAEGHEFMYDILNRLGFHRQPDGLLTREI